MKLGFKKKKKFISFVILGASILVSSYLIFAPGSPQNATPGITIVETNGSSTANPLLSYQSAPPENLTLNFANKTFQNAIDSNLYQTKGRASIIPPNSSAVQKTIAQIIDSEFSAEVVTSSDIIVNDDDSPQMQRLYLLYVDQVLAKIPTFSITSDAAPQSIFSTAADNFSEAATLLKAVRVPKPWIPIHYQILSLVIHQRNLFTDLAKSGDDPLRFLIALYANRQDPFTQGMATIQEEITKKVQDEKLI